MERYRVRASCNNANLSPNPNHLFHSSKPAAHIIPLPPKPTPHPISPELTTSLSRRIVDDEISIFDAERYFNGGGGDVDNTLKNNTEAVNILNGSGNGTTEGFVCNPTESSAASSVDGGYGRINNYFRARSFRASNPTASSEASWNSQTGLLVANAPGSVAVSVVRAYPLIESRRKGSSSSNGTTGTSFRGRRFFRLHCPCYGKKSVEVEDKFSESRSSIRSSSASRRQGFPKLDVDVLSNSSSSSSSSSTYVPKKETMDMMTSTKFKIPATEPGLYGGRRVVNQGAGSFSFPALSPVAVVPPLATKELELLEPARESLEVFRPSEELGRTLRKPSQHLRMAPVRDDDMASDTSSDLFELESFSAHPTSVYRRRDSLDELPKFRRSSEDSVAPSECYAPSEASVDWSVTTAEPGFDRASVANFSSAASDCGETEKGRFDSSAAAAGKEGGGVKKRGGGGGGVLLNCRSEKAVCVGPKPVRVGPD